MRYFAKIDAEGKVLGHYSTEVHLDIPSGALPMTDEEWLLSCQGRVVWDFTSEGWVEKSALTRTATQARAEKLAALASYRYHEETKGIMVGGVLVATDRESQAMVNGAYSSLKDGLILDTDWKGANGWVVVTLAEIQLIAQAVALHVRACFANERVHTMAINALPGHVAQIDNYDITTGW